VITFAGIGDEAGPGLDTQLDALARLGWASIELRTIGGTAVADLDDRVFGQLAEALAARGVSVACVASRIGNWSRPITADFGADTRELSILARRCAALGTPFIRVMSYPNAGLSERLWRQLVMERMRELSDRARQSGVVLLHENCAGWAGAHADRMLALLTTAGGPALRLLLDTGNGVAHGYQAYDMLPLIAEHVAHVHVKDARPVPGSACATPDPARTAPDPVYTIPGAGRARVADCLRLLLGSGYTGAWSIEPHLALRPHHGTPGVRRPPAAGPDGYRSFVASGLALETLVRDEVLPHFPSLAPAPGGIARRPLP
jgi:sugar phosphate isomerase/epimerase